MPTKFTHHELHLLLEALQLAEAGHSLDIDGMIRSRVMYHSLRSVTDDVEAGVMMDKVLALHLEAKEAEGGHETYGEELDRRIKAHGLQPDPEAVKIVMEGGIGGKDLN